MFVTGVQTCALPIYRHEASPIAAFIKGISLEYAGILYIETLKPGKHANRMLEKKDRDRL